MAKNDSHDDQDFLAELIAERTQHNPDFPHLVEEAIKGRRVARERVAQNGQPTADAPSIDADDQPDEANSIAPGRVRE